MTQRAPYSLGMDMSTTDRARTHAPSPPRWLARSAAGAAAAGLLLTALPGAVHAQTPPETPCTFSFNAAQLNQAVGPGRVGDCLENPHPDGAGNTVQATTGGLLFVPRSDNR